VTLGEPVIVHRRVVSGQDGHGNDIYSYVDVTVQALAFAPGAAVEVTLGRDMITTRPAVYLPSGTVVDGLSAVTARGDRYEVDGTPRVWISPFSGRKPGIEARLKEFSG
jgi:hypothetical protein